MELLGLVRWKLGDEGPFSEMNTEFIPQSHVASLSIGDRLNQRQDASGPASVEVLSYDERMGALAVWQC